jgi:myo-inositol-1(or 4)-monophosphatase
MASFSSVVKVMRNAMDKVSTKIHRDFIELENLQNSYKSSLRFAQMTLSRVNGDLEYLLKNSREEYGFFLNGRDNLNTKREKEYNWIVSSICGFPNLHRSIPYFCTSIALEKVDENGKKQIIAGLVENTITQETFIVEEGRGSYVNGRRIRVSGRNDIKDSFVALNFLQNEKNILEVFKKIEHIKVNNCALLDLVYIASGKYDAGLIYNPNEYETSVGLLILKEAGGYFQKVENGNLIIASANDSLQRQLLDII